MSKDIEKRISGKGRQGGSMNIRFSGFSNSLQSLNRRQSLTNILLNKQNVGQSGKKDLFVGTKGAEVQHMMQVHIQFQRDKEEK